MESVSYKAKHGSWSLTVRVTHWVVAAGVVVNCFNETGYLHRTLGYVCMIFVLLRVIDGLWFSHSTASRLFVPSCADIKLHLQEIMTGQVAAHVGHNPLGQLAVYVMWLLIMLLGFTGWLSRTDLFWGEDLPVQIHEMLAALMQAMVALHLFAVLLMSRLQHKNLIKAMIKNS